LTVFAPRPTCLFAATFALGCGGSECVTPPCALPVAVSVTVTSVVSGLPITNAFVKPANGSSIACNQGSGNTCLVTGGSGTYELDVGAPGYQTVHRTVVVTGTTPACGCETVNREQVNVGLPPG
jgi:hypothetical protein